MQLPRRAVWLIVAVVVVACSALGGGIYVRHERESREREAKQVRDEADRLRVLELLDSTAEMLHKPSPLTPVEKEELRQLRERAARRSIDKR